MNKDDRSLCGIVTVRPHTGYIPLLHQKIQSVPAKNHSILRRKPGITLPNTVIEYCKRLNGVEKIPG